MNPPQPLSNAQALANRVQELQDRGRFNQQSKQVAPIFSEINYAGFDTDAVRPTHVEPASELRDTAISHQTDQGPMQRLEKTNLGTLEHRAVLHSQQALPKPRQQVFISEAAQQPRPFNPETAKIRESERKIKEMTRSSHAIAYFARTPDKAEVKLVFCKPVSYQTDNVYEPYELEVIQKKDTEHLAVYYTINQNGVMRILNDEQAAKLNYQLIISQKRMLHPKPPVDPSKPRIIYQKPTEDTLESYLVKRPPEIMSPTAITDMCKVIGAFQDDSTEFVQLDRWILESSTFNILRNFKFFREYYARRSIDKWVAFRKGRQYEKNRATAQYHAFQGKSHFLAMMMEVAKQLVPLRDKQAIDIFAIFDYSEQEQKTASQTPTRKQNDWIVAQTKVQRKISEMMEMSLDNISQHLSQLVAILKQKSTDTVDQELQNMPLFQKQKLMKTKSITQTKMDQLQKRKEIKTAQEESKQICRLIALSDTMFLEALLMMLNKSSALLRDTVINPGTCLGLMYSELCFEGDQLVFTPSLADIQHTIESQVDELISTCNKPYQLYSFPSFREYFELPTHWERKSFTFQQIAAQDFDFQQTMKTIRHQCKLSTDKLLADSKVYNALLPLWDFSNTHSQEQYMESHKDLTCYLKELFPKEQWDFILPNHTFESHMKEEYQKAIENALSLYGTRPLEREILKFREWQSILSSKPSNYASGFAQLDARNLISKLQNVPQVGLAAVEKTAKLVISNNKNYTKNKIQAHLKVLIQQPQELEVFSGFIVYLESIDAEMDYLSSKVTLCDDLLNMLISQNVLQYQPPAILYQQFNKPNQQDTDLITKDQQKTNPPITGLGAKLTPEEKTEMEILHNEFNVLQMKKQVAENFANEQLVNQQRNMQEKLSQIKLKYQDVRTAVDKGVSNDHSSDPQVVLKHLKDTTDKIIEQIKNSEELRKHSSIINNWFQLMLEKKGRAPIKQTIVDAIDDVTTVLQKFQTELLNRQNLWKHMAEWMIFDQHVMQQNWIDSVVNAGGKKEKDGEEERKEADEQQQIVNKIGRLNAVQCCQFIADAYKDANKIFKQLPDDGVALYYKQQVQKMRRNQQIIMDLGNPNMQEHHWEEIFTVMDAPQFSYVQPFTFAQLLQANVASKKQEIGEISGKSTGESTLFKSVQTIETQWRQTKAKYKEHKSKFSSQVVFIVSSVDELYQQLDDSIAALQAMSGSKYIGRIKGVVQEWEENLSCIQEIYDELVRCQQAWLYLESIFAPEDIRRQLPTETSQFDLVDRFWRSVLTQIKESTSVVDILKIENLLTQLQNNNNELEKIQKKLEDYLETKRFVFPRFYFISNDELLQILSQTTDASSVIPFLRKIFEAISNLKIIENEHRRKVITQMISPENEVIDFVDPVIPTGGLVESWLLALEKEMFSTMKIKMKETMMEVPKYGSERESWLFRHPAQCILAAGQVMYVDAVENALLDDFQKGDRKQMEWVRDRMIEQINELTDLIVHNATSMQRKVITPLIVIEVYARDVCNQLLDMNHDAYSQLPTDFGWQKQLRHYWVIDMKHAAKSPTFEQQTDLILKNTQTTLDNIDYGDLIFKQTDFTFVSGYEYYGMANRLVVTPLTNKCYITLTSAISKFYGGNPLGPAGTGKTETCKDLIKTLQVSCLIFNCSDGLDYKSMTKFFCGLSMTGSFSVFDEFNRILVDTLSVISQQILTIQNAVKAKKRAFAFEHYESLPLNCRVGFFITFNPDYEGRSALPENVKALFRPIAMIVPDYALIAENFLFSEGFKNGKVLSKKMTQLYKLSSEQLSQQPHYDFGMRAIKSILYMAGKLKAGATGNESEDILLIRAMQDSNIPKFMAEDIILFNGIVQDLFPGIKIPKAQYGELEEEIKLILKKRGMQDNAEYVTKILQSYDTHIIRHGQMFVGEALTGKTIARDTLAQAISNLAVKYPNHNVYKPVDQYVLSAKAITMAELYGELNIVTNEWKDGLIAILARKILDIKDRKIFLVFDSGVDPVWIENLNTVLDDSKMFCLTNGERIRLSEDSNVMFETRDLQQASPATVSRCGMVYFSNEFIGYENYFKSLTLHNKEMVQRVMRMICFDEFNLDWHKLQDKLQNILSAEVNMGGDDDEEKDEQKADQEIDHIRDLILKKYPPYLKHYQLFELNLYKTACAVLAKMQIQFAAVVPALIKHVHKMYQEEAPTLDFQQVNAVVAYLSALVSERNAFQEIKLFGEAVKKAKEEKGKQTEGDDSIIDSFLKVLPSKTDMNEKNYQAPLTQMLLDQRFLFAITWGVGGAIKEQFYKDFDKTLRDLIVNSDKQNADQTTALLSIQNNLPPTESNLIVYDFRLDNITRFYAQWSSETKLFGSKQFDPNVLKIGGSIYDMIIPTTQFVKHCTLLTSLIRCGYNAYLCGATGTSKTIVVKTVFQRALNTQVVEKDDNNPVNYKQESDLLDINTQEIPFSAQTKAEIVENAIIEKLERKRKNTFFPLANRAMHCVFIDDADMPMPDKFGTQLPNELLRQILFQEGVYDRQKLTFKQLVQQQMILASQQPGAGRNTMNTRFTSRFVEIGAAELQKDAMISIFGTLLQGFLTSKTPAFDPTVIRGALPGVYSLVDLYSQIRTEIRATPMKAHYTFNLRDVARVVGGVFNIQQNKVKNEGDLLSVFIHEAHRVFRDRLVEDQDEVKFDTLLVSNFLKYFAPIQTGQQKDAQKEQPKTDAPPAEAKEEQEEQAIVTADPTSFGDFAAQEAKLSEIARCNVQPSNLMFGRWTNLAGVQITDFQNLPAYANLGAKPQEIQTALYDIIGQIYDEEPEQQKQDEDIDFEKLQSEKADNLNIKPVLFKEAIAHFSRMFRTLTQPAGHLLSIGLSGSGRKTLLKLVASSIEADVEEPTASRSFGVNELQELIKNCYLKSAQQKPVFLVLQETNLDAKDLFLEQINAILNGVALPVTVWKAEKEQVFDLARNAIATQNAAMGVLEQPNMSNQELWDVFYKMGRANFHVCLFLSPVGEGLRKRLRMFPALVNCTTIDWYKIWSNEALNEVALSYLSQIHPVLLNRSPMQTISTKMVKIHEAAGEVAVQHYAKTKIQNYVTPPMFMSFLQLFKSILGRSVGQLKSRQDTLSRGLSKLQDTSQKVAAMQRELNDLQPVLQQSILDTNALMKKLEAETVEVNKVRAVVRVESAEVAKKSEEVEKAKEEADHDLEEAKPAYQKAAKALEAFDKNSVLEIKSFKAPPVAVKFTMEAVCVLFNQPKVDWDAAVKLISENTFVQQVQNFDKDNIDPKILINLRKYTQKPDFNAEKVGKASAAAKVLCIWVIAIDKYAEIYAVIKPKMDQVEQLTKQSNEQKAALKIKQDELAGIEAKLQKLEDTFKESEEKKERLQQQVKQTEIDLDNAQKLIGGLSTEHTSWTQQISQLNSDLYSSVGDALLASAVIAYLGPYTSDQRANYIETWKQSIFTFSQEANLDISIPVSAKFALDQYNACADPRRIKDWKQKYSLPGDSGSIQSAVIVNQSKRYPFIIDPELQGITWLRKLEKLNNVQISGPSGSQLQQSIDNQISIGNPLIIENASEDLDPLLSSVLRKELFKKNNQLRIRVGDSDKEYNPDFKLFVTTRMRAPNFNPDIQAFAQVVNMAVSSKGLEEQLLSLVVQVENPTLEVEKDQIISALADAKEKQSQLQDELLDKLAHSQDPLKDESLIQKLEESKIQSQVIREQIAQGELTTQKVNQQRELFRSVAIRGRILYEAVAGLSTLDAMYTYSLEFFKSLFVQTLRKVEAGFDKEKRMQGAVTDACFLAVQRGLFERHKPTFAFMIASGIERDQKQITPQLWRMFNAGFETAGLTAMLMKSTVLTKPQIDHISELIQFSTAEQEFRQVATEKMAAFDEFCAYEQIENYEGSAQKNMVVLNFLKALLPFQKLLLFKIIRPSRLLFFLPIYTAEVMQNKIYSSPPNFDITETFKTVNSTTPVIFVLSQGSDPMLQISQYVAEQQMTNKFFTLALGQGQGEIAQRLLERAVKEGNWVCLQNVHLSETWLPKLQKFVEGLMSAGDVNDAFRLILTSMPSPKFPTSVLALSVKVANEPPRSVKQNVLMSYQVMAEEFHDLLGDAQPMIKHWKRTLFGISFFYAQLLERKRFGAVGYNSMYDFTVQDLQISQLFVRQYLVDAFKAQAVETYDEATGIIPYKPLNFMIGEVAFGGRISDFLDSRCVSTIMSLILQSKLFSEKCFMTVQNPAYTAPPIDATYAATIKHIEGMPNIELPSLFGLHDNAELSYQRTESQNIISFVQQMMPSDSGAGGMTVQQRDQKILQQLKELIEKVPQKLSLDGVKMNFNIILDDGTEMPSPYASVLRQECQRYNKLLGRIRQLFVDCSLAIQGLAIMSPELEQIYKGIQNNTLPQVIKSASYPSLKSLSSYVANLCKRVAFFSEWMAMRATPNKKVPIHPDSHSTELKYNVATQLIGQIPTRFWLGAFYFPHGLFTGVLQHHARVYSLSIDKLSFETSVLTQNQEDMLQKMQIDGIILTGMKSEGTRWDAEQKMLAEPIYGNVLEPLPSIWFRPVTALSKKDKFAIPLYTTVNRFGVLSTTGLSTNYVMNMHLDSSKEDSWWILRGAAAFIQDTE